MGKEETSIAEASVLAKLPPARLFAEIVHGRISARKIAGRWVVDVGSLDAYLAARNKAAKPAKVAAGAR